MIMIKSDLIVRENYLHYIRPFIDVKMVKIIVGVRRCGKSYLLDMIGDELLSRGIGRDHIVYKLYTSVELENCPDQKEMFRELKAEMKDTDKYYLLLDEVQEIEGWEKAVNTLFETCNVDIYVTGSNSKLTSANISSYLSGRYVLVPMYTLSFKEYLTFKNAKASDEAYKEYIRSGGFPIVAMSGLDAQKSYEIVEGIYQSIINKDVLRNHPIKELDKFERIVRFIMDNMGKTFSANSVSDYLKSQHREISVESVYNYISWLKDAFIIYECGRYDLKGKSILKTQEKYYLSDISLRYALFGYNKSMDDALLENVVYLELKRRGYDVYVGKNGTKEIDFIARKRDEEIEIQVAVELPSGSDREIGNLEEIKDFHHKYVVTANRNDKQTVNGIKVVYVADFLLMENW